MKRKLFLSAIISMVMLMFGYAVADAFTFGNVDGVWGRVDDGYDGIYADVVGEVDHDPGSAWTGGSPLKSTDNQTLRRNSLICTGDINGDRTLSEWDYVGASAVYTNLGTHTITNSCTYYGLFISEYIEGSWDAIELYNNTEEAIDFATKPTYVLIYAEGAFIPTAIIPLTGSIAANGTYVIAGSNIPAVTENLVDAAFSPTGDDAVVLAYNTVGDSGTPGPDGQADGAYLDAWATGPTGTVEDPTSNSTGRTIWTDWVDQSLLFSNTDWNQVRYGSGTDGTFNTQSGLAFNGIDAPPPPTSFSEAQPFPLGKFCHINRPISVSDSGGYQLRGVPLTITMSGISCESPAIAPFPPQTLSFQYPVSLEETTNALPCTWPSDSGNPCADAVTFGTAQNQTFVCYYPGEVKKTFTLALVGFMPLASADSSCSGVTYNAASSVGVFVSQERATNCGCLFGMITQSTVTSIYLTSFTAEGVEGGINVMWETANESDNLGFNLYRAESMDGERVLLNSGLIPTIVPPGSPFGGSYSYFDATAVTAVGYYYWLEDIDLAGEAGMHGPVTAITLQ